MCPPSLYKALQTCEPGAGRDADGPWLRRFRFLAKGVNDRVRLFLRACSGAPSGRVGVVPLPAERWRALVAARAARVLAFGGEAPLRSASRHDTPPAPLPASRSTPLYAMPREQGMTGGRRGGRGQDEERKGGEEKRERERERLRAGREEGAGAVTSPPRTNQYAYSGPASPRALSSRCAALRASSRRSGPPAATLAAAPPQRATPTPRARDSL